jgi:hypothetical protein
MFGLGCDDVHNEASKELVEQIMIILARKV